MFNRLTYFVLSPVTRFATLRNKFGGLINSLRTFVSVANGKPESSISSNNYLKFNTIGEEKKQHIDKFLLHKQ